MTLEKLKDYLYINYYESTCDEGFVINIRGGVFMDVKRFIKHYSTFFSPRTAVIVLDEDLKKEISPELLSLVDARIFVTRDPYDAYNHDRFNSKEDVVLAVCDKPVNVEQLARIENVLKVYQAKFSLKVIFFTRLLDEQLSRRKLVDATFAWKESENDFVRIKNPLYINDESTRYVKDMDRIDELIVNIKESVDELKECIDKMLGN